MVYRRTFRITKRLDGITADVRQRTNLVLCTPLYTLCTRRYCRYSALYSQPYTCTSNLPIKGNSLKPSDTLSVFVDVVGVSDAVFVGVGFQPVNKGFSFQGGQSILLTPLGINSVKRGGTDRRTLAQDRRFCEKVYNVAVLCNRFGYILLGSVA